MNEKEGIARLTVSMDPELFRKFKVICTLLDKTMTQAVNEVIVKEVQKFEDNAPKELVKQTHL